MTALFPCLVLLRAMRAPDRPTRRRPAMTETKRWPHLPDGAEAWRWSDEDRLRGSEPWGSGPWDDEPDKVSWTDPESGRPCLIVRGPMGGLCGYAAVDPGHPLHGVDYCDDDHREALDPLHDAAHGGLTFADGCAHSDDESKGICHVPQPGEPDDVWWFGFDCGHHMDFLPSLESSHRRLGLSGSSFGGTYRSLRYVAGRVQSLARALERAS